MVDDTIWGGIGEYRGRVYTSQLLLEAWGGIHSEVDAVSHDRDSLHYAHVWPVLITSRYLLHGRGRRAGRVTFPSVVEPFDSSEAQLALK